MFLYFLKHYMIIDWLEYLKLPYMENALLDPQTGPIEIRQIRKSSTKYYLYSSYKILPLISPIYLIDQQTLLILVSSKYDRHHGMSIGVILILF
jgi:hypothetical protein